MLKRLVFIGCHRSSVCSITIDHHPDLNRPIISNIELNVLEKILEYHFRKFRSEKRIFLRGRFVVLTTPLLWDDQTHDHDSAKVFVIAVSLSD